MVQFLLAFVTPEDMASDMSWATGLGDNICIDIDEESGPHVLWTTQWRRCPSWYLLKLYVDQRSAGIAQHTDGSTGGVSLNQVWMHQFFQSAMGLLSNNYAAVGILEQWNPSMQLFQAALKLPNLDWVDSFRKQGSARANADSAFKQTLFEAWDDPRIRDVLWLDILLYDHAVSVFNRQVEEYNIH